MHVIRQNYLEFVETASPRTSWVKSLAAAFVFGGVVSCIGEGFSDLYRWLTPYDKFTIASFSSASLVALAVLLTGLGVYDNLARIGGAGTFLPITGFANAISSAAIEHRAEGLIFGTGAKTFKVVGPVIVNGVFWSAVAAVIIRTVSLIS